MAITIPGVQRNNESVNTGVLGDINVPNTNIGEAYRSTLGTIAKVGANAAESYVHNVNKQEKQQQEELQRRTQENAKIVAKDIANQYSIRANQAVETFESQGINGNDFTPQYVDVNNQLISAQKDLLDQNQLDPNTRDLALKEINDKYTMYKMRADSNYARKNQAYKVAVTQAAVSNNKQLALDAASLVNPKDPKSFDTFDKLISKIEGDYKDFAQASGTVSYDKSGFPVYGEGTLKDIDKSRSEAIELSIRNLFATNQPQKAKAIFDRYSDYIQNKDKIDLNKMITKADYEGKINDVLNKVRTLPEGTAVNYINKLQDIPADMKQDLLKRDASLRVQDQERNNRLQKQAYSTVLSYANNQMINGKRWNSEKEFTNDPKIASLFSKMNPNQQRSVLSAIGQRSYINDDNQYKDFIRATETGEIKNWTMDQFYENTNKLDREHYNRAEKRYIDFKKEDKNDFPGLKSTQRTYLLSNIKSSLRGTLLKTNDSGSLTSAAQKVWNEKIENYLQVEMDKLPKDFKSSDERNKAIEKLTQDTILKFKPAPVQKKGWFDSIKSFFGGNDTAPSQPAQQQTAPVQPTQQQPTTGSDVNSIQKRLEEMRKRNGG